MAKKSGKADRQTAVSQAQRVRRMKFTLQVTWMPRGGEAPFRPIEGWWSRSFGPGEGSWTLNAVFVLGRLMFEAELKRYAP